MRSSQNKTKKINTFLIGREGKIFFLFGFVVLFLIFSYAFLIFSSVSVAYSLEKGQEHLVSINSENSTLESKFSIDKEGVMEDFKTRLVMFTEVEYVDSSFEKLVFNKR
jgi:hypothetical protein